MLYVSGWCVVPDEVAVLHPEDTLKAAMRMSHSRCPGQCGHSSPTQLPFQEKRPHGFLAGRKSLGQTTGLGLS